MGYGRRLPVRCVQDDARAHRGRVGRLSSDDECHGTWTFVSLRNAQLYLCSQWLHYLASKLLRSKASKAPTAAKKAKVAEEAPLTSSDPSGFSERECYEALTDLEQWLGQALIDNFPGQAKAAAAAAKGKGRRATVAPAAMHLARNEGPACAGEVVEYGVKRGWVRASRLI